MEPIDRSPSPSGWRFNQSIGDENVADDCQEADAISAIAFSPNGNYLAVGDRSGKIWIHQEKKDKQFGARRHYEHYTYFQSHKHDIDYLKSQDIEEKINMIRWCANVHSCQMLLSTNDKTIKLWRVYNHFIHTLTGLNRDFLQANSRLSQLRIPRVTRVETVPACALKSNFCDAHAYHINSISLCSDHETFISSDDLRINMWNLSVPNASFNIIDMRPACMEDLTEVITAAQFHPIECNQLVFSSSRGLIRIMDMRNRALLSSPDLVLESAIDPAGKSFFSEIVASISDVQYSADGRFIIARDYLTAKVWDPRLPKMPVEVAPIHDYIKPKLAEVYENDSIFDKFEVCASSQGVSPRRLLTGSYGNEAVIFDWDKRTLDRIKPIQRTGSPYDNLSSYAFHGDATNAMSRKGGRRGSYDNKCLHVAWHPSEDVVAVSSLTDLNIFQRL